MKRGFLDSSKKEPADSRTIRKFTREASIDTLQAASIDNVNQASNDTIQLTSDNTSHPDTVHRNTVHPNTVHPVKNDTTCGETEKIEVLILEVD